MTVRVKAAFLAAAGAMSLAGTANAFVNWATPAGAGSFFTFSGGGSDFGLIGNQTMPLPGGNTFQFFPPAFLADSNNTVAASMTDRIEVVLKANATHKFTQILVSELGDWAITGIGTVRDSGTLQVVDNINPRFPPAVLQPLGYTVTGGPPNAMPITLAGSGTWTGSALIDFTTIAGPDWTEITLVLTNTVQATTGPSSSSHIQKLFAQAGVTITVLPSPAGATLLGLAGVFAARRRRR